MSTGIGLDPSQLTPIVQTIEYLSTKKKKQSAQTVHIIPSCTPRMPAVRSQGSTARTPNIEVRQAKSTHEDCASVRQVNTRKTPAPSTVTPTTTKEGKKTSKVDTPSSFAEHPSSKAYNKTRFFAFSPSTPTTQATSP